MVMSGFIGIHLNGETVQIQKGLCLEELVRERGHASDEVAVEVNCELVPRPARAEYSLQDEDRVEFVTLVGGG
jgi:thiamine biosynthesis protein ThiS